MESTYSTGKRDFGTAILDRSDRIDHLVSLVGKQLENSWDAEGAHLARICHYALVPGGKLFRPLLLLESAGAVGADVEQVVPAAAGAEAGHVASLIHDDIIDGDAMRRGRPSVHAAYGRDDAIVAGDALIFYLFAALGECGQRGVPDERVARAMTAVAAAGIDLCRGQSMEAELCEGYVCDVPSYLEMIRLKTSALFRAACASGAILGGGPPEWCTALAGYGELLGSAFQIHDDLLAYTSDGDAMGKAVTSDIANQRLTLPFLLARELGGEAVSAELDRQLRGTGDPAARLAAVSALVREAGGVEAAADAARGYAVRATEVLDVLPGTPSKETLSYFAQATVNRCG
ncbi:MULTISPECIES: polyprenyl synthetase family protein [Amycolatopsis]|uniref:Polyprenyl synthetase family protein n=1 Tax=Amycolatopsis dendrobii TaxID=2760662 RepID=A0A7W3W3G3_9PSEU|nr:MULTISPECIES: polyprenyl synthetase family protein [Amycolatopsis]MBB1158191.1 polyprenyl synthetase family protein [Amycolatopsis dendrobii]UKD56960.1 polyprenyl synthetase family protein [Amycolatopsis sp. FU40]